MARKRKPDAKEAALAETRTLNPRPEAVGDEQFASSEFFDARDLVQVKYEMVRRVRVDGAPVTQTAAAFGFSRPSYYEAAAAVDRDGLGGLVPAKPGPRRAHKLTDEVIAYARQLREPIPASGRRSWLMRSRPSSRSGCTRDRWSGPWPALKTPKVEARNDIDDTGGDGSDVVDGYEQLRARALGGDADGWRLGLGVLQQRGVAAWLRVRQATVADGRHRPRPPGPHRPSPGAWRPSWSGCWRRWRWPLPPGVSGMSEQTAAKVTGAHLARTAYLYVRQSTLRQVLTNTESATRQYALRQKAIALGWPAERIVTIDTDQGQSGASGRRPGRLPAPGRRGRHGPRRDRAGPGGVAAGPQQRRLAPAAGDLRHVGAR